MSRRVVVTGLGLITPVGNTVETTWENLLAGRSGVGPVTLYNADGHNVRIAAEVKDYDIEAVFGRKEARRHDRYQFFAAGAAQEAVASAGLEIQEADRSRTSVIVGSAVGGIRSFEDQMTAVLTTGDHRKVTPFGIPMLIVNGGSNMVSIMVGATGPSQTPTSACATGADCIGQAFDLIRLGRIDTALAGAAEAPIAAIGLAAFDRIGAMSRCNDDPEGAMRPFAVNREGLVFAEGAGVLVLEEYERARARGAPILAELVGYGSTSDAFHITAPEPEGVGASEAIRLALEDASLNPEDVDYVNAHGTATALNDPMETKAIRRVFGAYADQLPVSSTKSMTGHGMGMTAALEAVFSVLALRDQRIPPTINLHEPDPECDLDFVPHTARDAALDVVMTNAFGFGGHNASLIFKKV